jgi:hypothetical protein
MWQLQNWQKTRSAVVSEQQASHADALVQEEASFSLSSPPTSDPCSRPRLSLPYRLKSVVTQRASLVGARKAIAVISRRCLCCCCSRSAHR